MSQHPRQTIIHSSTFRWNGHTLEQEIQVIQHYPEATRDVGLYRSWIPVKVDGNNVFGVYVKENLELRDQVARLQNDLKDFHSLWQAVPHRGGQSSTVESPISHDAMVPEGYILVEFDGGTSCNIPAQGYGEGYGSFQIDHGEIHRVKFGKGHSSNASEILTLAAAMEHLYSRGGADSVKLFIRGDSQIALKWATDKSTPKAKTSECFKQAIARLRLFNGFFADIKTEWRGRRHSVKLFGH